MVTIFFFEVLVLVEVIEGSFKGFFLFVFIFRYYNFVSWVGVGWFVLSDFGKTEIDVDFRFIEVESLLLVLVAWVKVV